MSKIQLNEFQIKNKIRTLAQRTSQSRVAKHFGVSESYISRYLHDQRPLPHKILKQLDGETVQTYLIDEEKFEEMEIE